jgi:hypothetical protein
MYRGKRAGEGKGHSLNVHLYSIYAMSNRLGEEWRNKEYKKALFRNVLVGSCSFFHSLSLF